MTEIAQRYRRCADVVERTIAGVRDDQWANPSPCAAWTARDVVGHLLDMHGHVLRPAGRTLHPEPAVRDDPLGAFRLARAEVAAVLDDPELAGTECDTPAGRMTVERQIDGVLTNDLVLHGWDLARATGQDDTMPPEDVARLWAANAAVPAELMAKYRTPGAFGPGVEVFGPEVPVAEDAPLQDRLLGFIGRDPNWTPPGQLPDQLPA
ncbi:TIGR03086 family metal-binding protein [Goodfellowiella coeruleoviolacea]|uniref:TIGR03086 family protein n=1 Tax=Goodfellowiella coeruleoviolacea TaxID=334858 RepID=A0AAE3KL62_9PSEU|nr:TIGR03086 family metal-binding protein [Goodfellowiella coeruleoviolacea]MCP2166193.1 TIGR03086 family protein [Goodfellowiella coeruleoviolacea]